MMKTLVNFRDIGGYATLEGKVIKQKFFRSGEVLGLSEEDRNIFTQGYGIHEIYDFRSIDEVRKRPDDSFFGVRYLHLDVMGDTLKNDASFMGMVEQKGDPDELMYYVYEQLVTAKGPLMKYKDFIEHICHPQPILFHCFAGKDRTGIAAAIILKILGVSKEDIMEDYLMTNVLRKKKNEELLAELRKQGAEEQTLQKMMISLYVKREYLEHAFAKIMEFYGSFDVFVREGLQLEEHTIRDMKALFIE